MSHQEDDTAEVQSVNKVIEAFEAIDARRRQVGRVQYNAIASGAVRGRPLTEVRNLTFMVGVANERTELTLNELIALFYYIADHDRQVAEIQRKNVPPGTQVEIDSTLNLMPSDEEISHALARINLREPGEPLRFDPAPDRMKMIFEMVRKKMNAPRDGTTPNHFKVYPPKEYLDRPSLLSEPDVFDRLRDTVWWVRWYDGVYDQLSFGEFLVFVDQIIAASLAFRKAAAQIAPARRSKHSGGWQPKKDRSKKPKRETIKITSGLDMIDLITDQHIRELMTKVTLEPVTRPSAAMN